MEIVLGIIFVLLFVGGIVCAIFEAREQNAKENKYLSNSEKKLSDLDKYCLVQQREKEAQEKVFEQERKEWQEREWERENYGTEAWQDRVIGNKIADSIVKGKYSGIIQGAKYEDCVLFCDRYDGEIGEVISKCRVVVRSQVYRVSFVKSDNGVKFSVTR